MNDTKEDTTYVPHHTRMCRIYEEAKSNFTKSIIAERLDNACDASNHKDTKYDKVVHFLRHGQGEHNAFADKLYKQGHQGSSPYGHPDCPMDPHLTELGIEQAKANGQKLSNIAKAKANNDGAKVAVITSSLRRALQTTKYALESTSDFLDEDTRDVFLQPVAYEDCREIFGSNQCDTRNARSVLSEEFPNVDFQYIESNEDPMEEKRESSLELAKRAHEFALWLQNVEQKEILVVTHSAFLCAMLFVALEDANADPSDKNVPQEDKLGGWFSTGELRSFGFRFTNKD